MTVIIDYDAGNVKSVENACRLLGHEASVTSDNGTILKADRVILPGVGDFGACMGNLRARGLVETIKEVIAAGTPFLGICVGQQLLFSGSEESPGVPGLSILPGRVRRFPDNPGVKIPHIGWNDLTVTVNNNPLFKGVKSGDFVYFVHSYYVDCEEEAAVAATAEYDGVVFHAAIRRGNLFACQFHPEKSSEVGLGIVRNFLEL